MAKLKQVRRDNYRYFLKNAASYTEALEGYVQAETGKIKDPKLDHSHTVIVDNFETNEEAIAFISKMTKILTEMIDAAPVVPTFEKEQKQKTTEQKSKDRSVYNEKPSEFSLNEPVTRYAGAKDYTTGRKGTIIEIGSGQNEGRFRVHWTKEANGKNINIRTWCKPEGLR